MTETKDNPIFSGDYSRDMWTKINSIKGGHYEIHDALYLIGCRLQELEARIRKAQEEGKCAV